MDPNLPTEETMSEGSAEKSSMGMEDCIPLNILAMPDEGDQMQEPAVGDQVQYSVEGKVTRIEGGQAYVQKTAVNGQKIEDEAPKDEMGELEGMAEAMPESY
jgi:hypothetical protein